MGYYPYYSYYYDPTYILVFLCAIASIIASAKVNSTFRKYDRVRSMTGMTGAQAAQTLLYSAGIYDVTVEHVSGSLTDHYDPSAKVLRLSDATYGSSSVAAVGVAAHECGHAIQYHTGYTPIKVRNLIAPVCNIGNYLGWIAIVIGLALGRTKIAWFGFVLMLGILVFRLVTLPVEFDASRRAMAQLREQGILGEQELHGTRKVLKAAALTYVASAAAAILQLLRVIILFGGRDRDD